MRKSEKELLDIIYNCSRKEIEKFTKEYEAFIGPLSQEARDEIDKLLASRPEEDPDPIKVNWNEYTGISDGYAEYRVLKDGSTIYRTSTMKIAPKDEKECLDILKEIVENMNLEEMLRK